MKERAEEQLVSVILPVYNGGKYLGASVDSILRQDWLNFELIIINDGSTDNSKDILGTYTDRRIRTFHQTNKGLASSLNFGIAQAKGNLIARQDQDDISAPERLRKQVSYLSTHPGIALLGTAAEIINDDGSRTGRSHKHPCEPLQLKYALLFDNYFVHSSVMVRREAVEMAGNYDIRPDIFEDYDLWSRISAKSEVANLSEPLVQYREVHSGMSRSAPDYRARVVKQSCANISANFPELEELTVKRFAALYHGTENPERYKDTLDFFVRTLNAITVQFARNNGVEPAALRGAKRRLLINFKRRLLGAVINDRYASPLQRLGARISRRLLLARIPI